MFDNLTKRLNQAFKTLTGQSHFTEENTQQALREVRMSLLEADVALPVVKQFIEKVREKHLARQSMINSSPSRH